MSRYRIVWDSASERWFVRTRGRRPITFATLLEAEDYVTRGVLPDDGQPA